MTENGGMRKGLPTLDSVVSYSNEIPEHNRGPSSYKGALSREPQTACISPSAESSLRWSERAFLKPPQVDDSIGREIHFSTGQPCIPFERGIAIWSNELGGFHWGCWWGIFPDNKHIFAADEYARLAFLP
jgi:hypothetical protein